MVILHYSLWQTNIYIDRLGFNVRKRTLGQMRTTMTQISLRICAVWSESSLSARGNFASFAIESAGLGGSVGCAVRLETRRSCVQPPLRSTTFFRGDWSWNIFYAHDMTPMGWLGRKISTQTNCQNVPSKDSYQTVRLCRLIWIFAERKWRKVRVLTLRLNWYCIKLLKAFCDER